MTTLTKEQLAEMPTWHLDRMSLPRGKFSPEEQRLAQEEIKSAINERKGPNNKGVRTHQMNSYDNRAAPNKPITGTKMDGQKGRW